MRIRIVDNGSRDGLQVINLDNGEVLSGINYVVYEKDPLGPARVLLGMVPESVDLSVDQVDVLKDEVRGSEVVAAVD